MKSAGITPIMITGDNQRTAESVAAEVGIKRVMAEVLPDDKTREIRDIQAENVRVAMVGDGINDAPALTQADIGIAIGAGTDVAIESADIVLMGNRLGGVMDTYEIGKNSYSKTKQNLFIAFGFNGIGVPAMTGLVHPVFSMLAMLASVTLVLGNSFGGQHQWRKYQPRLLLEGSTRRGDGRTRGRKSAYYGYRDGRSPEWVNPRTRLSPPAIPRSNRDQGQRRLPYILCAPSRYVPSNSLIVLLSASLSLLSPNSARVDRHDSRRTSSDRLKPRPSSSASVRLYTRSLSPRCVSSPLMLARSTNSLSSTMTPIETPPREAPTRRSGVGSAALLRRPSLRYLPKYLVAELAEVLDASTQSSLYGIRGNLLASRLSRVSTSYFLYPPDVTIAEID